MAVSVPSNWSSNLSKPASKGGVDPTTVGNPADLGGYRGMQQERGQAYDERANEAYDWGMGQRGKLGELGDRVTEQALDTSKTFGDWAKADRGFWEGTYKPAMQEHMDFARGYTTPGRMAANWAGAISQVNITGEAMGNKAKQELMGFGVDPSVGTLCRARCRVACEERGDGCGSGHQVGS
jgi:hypothetical protein